MIRRHLLGSLAALPMVTPLAASARGPAGVTTAPAIASLRIGRAMVHFLSDGAFEGPLSYWTGAPAPEIASRIAALDGGNGQAIRLNVTAWLVDDGARLTLIDAGVPGGAVPTLGRIPAALRALGVAPEHIDLIAVTHTHFDHIGGLVSGGRAVYPRAELLVPRADAAYFTDAAIAAASPSFMQSSFQLTAAVLAAYPRAQRIDGAREIAPFISAVPTPGHTPGSTAYRISDGGRSLLIVSDSILAPALHPATDNLGIIFEADPAAARAMRARLFAQAAEERALLAATHMPFPGLGRITRDNGVLRWAVDSFPQDS